MIYIRVRVEKQGGHYHCRSFSGQGPQYTLGCNGTLVFDEREWPDARERLQRFANEVIEEREEP